MARFHRVTISGITEIESRCGGDGGVGCDALNGTFIADMQIPVNECVAQFNTLLPGPCCNTNQPAKFIGLGVETPDQIDH